MSAIEKLARSSRQEVLDWRRRWEYRERPIVELSRSLALYTRSRQWRQATQIVSVGLAITGFMWFVATVPLVSAGVASTWWSLSSLFFLAIAGITAWFGITRSEEVWNAGAGVAHSFLDDLTLLARELYLDAPDDEVAVRRLLELPPRERRTLERYEDRLTYLVACDQVAHELTRNGRPFVGPAHPSDNLIAFGRKFDIERRERPWRAVIDRLAEYRRKDARTSAGSTHLCMVHDRTAQGVHAVPAAVQGAPTYDYDPKY